MFAIISENTDRCLLTRREVAAVVKETDARRLDEINLRVSALMTKACKVAATGATPPTLRLEAVSDTYRLKSHQSSLLLSRRPVVSITSLVEAGVTLTRDVDYEIDTGAGIAYRLAGDTRARWHHGLVAISYSAGWQKVPDDLKELACKFATMISAESGRDPSLGQENIPGVYEATYRYGRPDDPLVPREIMEGLRAGGYVNDWIG